MNWIESRISEVRLNQLERLELVFTAFGIRDTESPVLPAEVGQLRHLRSLIIHGFRIPSFEVISGLTELTELHIGWCQEVEISRNIEKLKNLKILQLSGLGLRTLPFRIDSLEALEVLNVFSNHLTTLPTSIKNLTKLRALDVSFNDLELIPPVIRRIPSLKKLSFGSPKGLGIGITQVGTSIETIRNLELETLEAAGMLFERKHVTEIAQLTTICDLKFRDTTFTSNTFPIELRRLPRLRALEIEHNTKLSVPDEIAEFCELREFSLSYDFAARKSRPEKVSSHLLKCSHLEVLSLEGQTVENIYPDVFALPSLRCLTLNECYISELPSIIGAARQLEQLDFSRNDIGPLPAQLFDLTNLNVLWLHKTGRREVPKEIGGLSKLKQLSIGEWQASHLPGEIGELKELQVLHAWGNRFVGLPPEISNLSKLEIVRLDGNQLPALPRDLVLLPRLRLLHVENNPILTPPPEIVAQGTAAIQNYFTALSRAPFERLYEAKLLIVGEGAVGKTCLARRLVNRPSPATALGEEVESTEGIDIYSWDVTTPQTAHFRVNMWDFGGQEIYHATHQFFLTKRSLYLFVWDARREDRTGGFDYWLNVIRLLSADSSVIVVLNKADERIREIDEADLKRHFPNVQEFHKVSALYGTGVDTLRDRITDSVTKLPHVGDEWPVAWSSVRRVLEKDMRDYITVEEYETICAVEQVPPSESRTLAAYLHDLGVILHFHDDVVLQRIVILKPEWGTNAVYRVLDTRNVQDAKGRFSRANLAAIWDSPQYPPSRHPELLQLMIKFELCFPLGMSGNYVAPELLSAEMPSLDWDSNDNLIFEYHYPFMPAGILTRFIARIHTIIDGEKYWRNGVALAWRGGRALVVGEPLSRRIRVAVRGRDRRELLGVVRHHIDEIHRTLNDPLVTEKIPCICERCRSNAPHLFVYKTLEAYLLKGIEEIRCEKSLENVPIRKLLSEVVIPRAITQALASGQSNYSIARVETLHIHNGPSMKPTHTDRPHRNNPWMSGSFYIVVVVSVFGLLLAVGKVLSPFWLPIFILGGLLLVTVIGAFQLKNDDRLQDQNFLKLVALAFKQIPFLGKLSRNPSDVKPDK
jgi:internalin A